MKKFFSFNWVWLVSFSLYFSTRPVINRAISYSSLIYLDNIMKAGRQPERNEIFLEKSKYI